MTFNIDVVLEPALRERGDECACVCACVSMCILYLLKLYKPYIDKTI